jgi:hypothetical protein
VRIVACEFSTSFSLCAPTGTARSAAEHSVGPLAAGARSSGRVQKANFPTQIRGLSPPPPRVASCPCALSCAPLRLFLLLCRCTAYVLPSQTREAPAGGRTEVAGGGEREGTGSDPAPRPLLSVCVCPRQRQRPRGRLLSLFAFSRSNAGHRVRTQGPRARH